MAAPGGQNNSDHLFFIVLLLTIFWSAPQLFALPSPGFEKNRPTNYEYAHSHRNASPQPTVKPAKITRSESVQLDVTGARFSCSDDDCSHHRDCDLEIDYHLSSTVNKNFDIATEVVCRARLDYTTSHGYHLQSERCSSSAAHTLHHHDDIHSTVVVTFLFSPYEEVVDAQVGAIHCHIEGAELVKTESPR